jgi:hypothetical protein
MAPAMAGAYVGAFVLWIGSFVGLFFSAPTTAGQDSDVATILLVLALIGPLAIAYLALMRAQRGQAALLGSWLGWGRVSSCCSGYD